MPNFGPLPQSTESETPGDEGTLNSVCQGKPPSSKRCCCRSQISLKPHTIPKEDYYCVQEKRL